MKTLILGGIKSGKSRLAESLAIDSGKPVVVIATATADDDEMRQRIARHRESRPGDWLVVEETIELAGALQEHSAADNMVIVDCLTLWLTNLLVKDNGEPLRREIAALQGVLGNSTGEIVLVSNETSMGIIPMGELTRIFCDEAGILHQQVASCCDNVALTIAGLPLVLKGELTMKEKND